MINKPCMIPILSSCYYINEQKNQLICVLLYICIDIFFLICLDRKKSMARNKLLVCVKLFTDTDKTVFWLWSLLLLTDPVIWIMGNRGPERPQGHWFGLVWFGMVRKSEGGRVWGSSDASGSFPNTAKESLGGNKQLLFQIIDNWRERDFTFCFSLLTLCSWSFNCFLQESKQLSASDNFLFRGLRESLSVYAPWSAEWLLPASPISAVCGS